MKITVSKIDPLYHSKEPHIVVHVRFEDDKSCFHSSAEVTINIEKSDKSLSEIKNLAIQKASDFLSQIVSAR